MKPDDRDERTTMDALHRQASSRVDAAPDPSVRAAVLAAAARAVDARPQALDAGPAAAPFGRRRWPVSMAALLVVSLMTGLVVNQALRDEPDRVTSAVAPPPAPAAPAPAPTLAATPDDGAPTTTSAGPAASGARRAAAVAKPERPRADHGHALDGFVRDVSPEPSADRVQPAAKIVATPPPPAPMQAAPAPPVAPAPSGKAVAAPPRAAAAAEAATVARPVAASNTAQRMRRGPEPLTPEAWVERIVRLREAGDGAAADREVEALRARYPDFEVPAAALAPTGPR